MKRIALFVFVTIALVGCGQKSFFSSWKNDSTGSVLDLSNAKVGSAPAVFILASGVTCNGTINIVGSETEGTGSVSNTSGGTGCSDLEASYTYKVDGGTLTLCKASACSTYH